MAHSLRNRPLDIGRERAEFLSRRFGQDLRVARVSNGLSQRSVSRAARVSQAFVSKIERGLASASVDAASRIAAAVGSELGLVLYPGKGVGLRDSGQLRMAELVAATLPIGARVTYELPVGAPPDRRAADMVIEMAGEVVLVEVERLLVDYQAQYRAAQLKRAALGSRLQSPKQIRFVWVVSDTRRNRRALEPHASVIAGAFGLSSRGAWTALATGGPLGADALIWLRERDRSHGGVTARASAHSRAG